MSEKAITDMTDDEILAEIQTLRERRAQARERRVQSKASAAEGPVGSRKRVEEISAELSKLLGDLEET